MTSDPGDGVPNLTVLESVRCLECAAVYTKPAGGGTVQQNPGCPDCGYVGWIGMQVATFSEPWTPRHLDVGHLPRPFG